MPKDVFMAYPGLFPFGLYEGFIDLSDIKRKSQVLRFLSVGSCSSVHAEPVLTMFRSTPSAD